MSKCDYQSKYVFAPAARAAVGVSAAVTVIVILLGLLFTQSAYADMGMPENPKYKVVTSIYGTDYYNTDFDDDGYAHMYKAGSLAAGVAFYVWGDENSDGTLWGTTDASAGSEDYEEFVYIYSSDIMNESDFITAETGERTEETMYALTTDKLNVRTGPGSGFKVLEVLPEGTYVEYDHTFNSGTTWMFVTINGESGWISGDYLRRTKKIEDDYEAPDESDTSDVEYESADPETNIDVNVSNTKKYRLFGMILICIGAAILASTLAYYLLTRKSEN